jgi:hypothetical protein
MRSNRILCALMAFSVVSTASCARAPKSDNSYPAGLWDAHTHLTYWGEDALDSLTKYGVVGVRDLGGDPVKLRAWRDEINRGARRGPRIFFSGPHINGPRNDSLNRLIVRTPADAERADDSLASLGVDFVKTHVGIPREAYFAVLRQARLRHLKVASHVPRGVAAWEAADSGAASIEHIVESILVSPMWAEYVKTLEQAMDWWLSPAGDTMIAHIARTHVVVTPTLCAYIPFIAMGRNQEEKTGRQRVFDTTIELTRRFHKAGIVLLAGSDFANKDKDMIPGKSLVEEIRCLEQSGLSKAEARAAASTNIIAWLKKKP